MNIMKNKKLKNYDRCIDSRILNLGIINYIHSVCKYIYGESISLNDFYKIFAFAFAFYLSLSLCYD